MTFYTNIQWVENHGNRWFNKIHIAIICEILYVILYVKKWCDRYY